MHGTELNTILFDLDGTLLPMEQDAFVEAYLGLLGKRAAALGYDPAAFIRALWKGSAAMMQNDGAAPNQKRFWDTFAQLLGPAVLELEGELEDFYATDFNQARSVVGSVPDVRGLLRCLRDKGYGVALATNPLFPPVAVASRLGWVGLSPADFDHITTYQNSRYCKPSLGYYQELLAALGRTPGQCMMVGNNPVDDMAASQLGLRVFLLTDHLENPGGLDISAYPHGDFSGLAALAAALPRVR